jgi:hypothetical protein
MKISKSEWWGLILGIIFVITVFGIMKIVIRHAPMLVPN